MAAVLGLPARAVIVEQFVVQAPGDVFADDVDCGLGAAAEEVGVRVQGCARACPASPPPMPKARQGWMRAWNLLALRRFAFFRAIPALSLSSHDRRRPQFQNRQ